MASSNLDIGFLFKAVTFNMHGYNQGISMLNKLCNDPSVNCILIQESWCTPMNLHRILQVSPNFSGYGISAMTKVLSTSILRGRPFGGVHVLIRNNPLIKVNCLCAVEHYVILLIGKTLIVNAYFPCSSSTDYTENLHSILAEIGDILVNYPEHEILFGGDFNVDLRVSSTGSNIINKFMIENNLILCNNLLDTNSRHTYHHEGLGFSSYVDFFLVRRNTNISAIVEHIVIDDALCFSDHLPVMINIMLHCSTPQTTSQSSSSTQPVSIHVKPLRWDKANLYNYYAASYSHVLPILNAFSDPYVLDLLADGNNSSALNVDSDPEDNNYTNLTLRAIEFIETTYSKLINALDKAANNTVPRLRVGALKYWWDQELEALKENSITSHRTWLEAGKPNSGPLFDDKKTHKYAYRNALRNKQKRESNEISNSLHDCLLNKDQNSFWKTWRNKFGKPRVKAKNINGKVGDHDIAEEFADSFAKACTPNSEQRNNELYSEFLEAKLSYSDNSSAPEFKCTVEMVDTVIQKLKLGKAASVDNITAEHVKYCHPAVSVILSKLFMIMVKYNYVPNGFGIAVTVPIPKGENSQISSNSDQYRGITISSVLSKIFEHCLLLNYSNFLTPSDFQFGFKKQSGCSHAVYSVRKTVDYFVERDSTVNVCSLDLAKAFDKMNKYALFIKLIKRKCPIAFVNILDKWYDKMFTCVRWGSALSSYVKLNAGVRQGGILSPILFAIFVDDILLLLSKSGLGCHINRVCFNSFLYADDLLLLSISICDLQKMIDICKHELDWLDMKINVKKSVWLRIGKRFKISTADILIDDKPIKVGEEFRYLGMYVVAAKSFSCNMHEAKMKYFRSLNGILGKVGTDGALNVILSLVDAFATPVLLYGLESAGLKPSHIDKLNYPYRSIFVKLFSTFDKSVIEQCQFYTGYLPLKQSVHLKCLRFFKSLMFSPVNSTPAGMLYEWFGSLEWQDVAMQYDILLSDSPFIMKRKIWSKFKMELNL